MNEFKDVKFIYFDLGYTLVNERRVWSIRLSKQVRTDEARKLKIDRATIIAETEKASHDRAHSPYRTALTRLGLSNIIDYEPEYESIYSATAPLLRKLSEKYKLGVLANQNGGIRDRLRKFGIIDYFDVVVSSSDFDICKPDIRLFQIAAEKANVAPENILMIGDRLDNDIIPAKQMGFKTVWVKQGFGAFQEPTAPFDTPDVTVNKLSELSKIL